MSRATDKVWTWLDSVAGPFYPPGIRRYLTLKSMTLFVLFLVGVNLLVKILLPIEPATSIQRNFIDHYVRSRFFLVPFDAGLLMAVWFLIVAKPRTEYEYLRAFLFGMVLAASLGEFLILFVPWRR